MKELMNILAGEMSLPAFAAALIFAFLGWVLYKYYTSRKRNKESDRTPIQWSWSFWLQDNWLEMVLVVIQLYVLVRFAAPLLSYFSPDVWELAQSADSMFIYFLVGYGMSYITNKLKKLYIDKKS